MPNTRKTDLTKSLKKITNKITRTVKKWAGGFINPSTKNIKSTPSASKKTKSKSSTKKIIKTQKSLASFYPSVLNR
jgi:hypothetical protein